MEGKIFGGNESKGPEHTELHDMTYHAIKSGTENDKIGAPIELYEQKNYKTTLPLTFLSNSNGIYWIYSYIVSISRMSSRDKNI